MKLMLIHNQHDEIGLSDNLAGFFLSINTHVLGDCGLGGFGEGSRSPLRSPV